MGQSVVEMEGERDALLEALMERVAEVVTEVEEVGEGFMLAVKVAEAQREELGLRVRLREVQPEAVNEEERHCVAVGVWLRDAEPVRHIVALTL